ncbi:MAG: helix-turn-helix domain-containing protein [Eubacteriales bacterium]
MKTLTLGEKVRLRRRQLGMTQADLSGTFITRNMISRIETGDINPSLETLKFLAEKLEVPAGYLLTEGDDLAEFLRPSVMREIRRLFLSGDDRAVLALCGQYGYDDTYADDESAMLLCECTHRLGKQAYAAGDTDKAGEWFDRSLRFAEKTAYHTETIRCEAALYRAMLAELAGESPLPYLNGYASSVSEAVGAERYLLLRFLYEAEHTDSEGAGQHVTLPEFENTLYRSLITVWKHAEAGETADARALLETVLSEERAALGNDPLLLYRCTVKMEQLSAASDDYKAAYEYAAKRRQLEKRYHIQSKEDLAYAKSQS